MTRKFRLLAASYVMDFALALLPADIAGRNLIYRGMTEMFKAETR